MHNQDKIVKCFSCEAKPGTWRCVICEVFLCETCSGVHESNPANEKHKVVSTCEISTEQTAGNVRDKPRCTKHNKTLKFYCETCNELVCRDCMEFDHTREKHPCLPAEDVAKEKKVKLKSSFRILESKLKKENQALQAVSNATQRLEDNFAIAKEQVSQQKREILETFTLNLEQKAQEMIEELDKEYKKVKEPLLKQNAELKWHFEKVKITSDLTKSLLEKGNYEEIISSQMMIEEKVEKMDKERPKPMKPVHYGDIQYRSKERKDAGFVAILSNLGDVVCGPLSGLLYNASDILRNEEGFVDKMEEWLRDLCKWRLFYRATRDGWSAQDFHIRCDDKGPSVTLVKVRDYIFGGYTDQSWGGLGYKESTSSFLFSLRNSYNLSPFKAPVFQHYKNATWNNRNYGPCFGYGYYGCDLYISNNPHISSQSYTNLGYMYKPPEGYVYKEEKTFSLLAGSYYFKPDEIEVFF